MISKNDATLEFYEQSADLYEQRNLKDYSSGRGQAENAKHRRFIASSLEGVSKDAVLFEIGSAYGRDALFIKSLGYKIQVSDAVESFLERLRKEGCEPVKFNLITDELPGTFDYILANAVLVHLTKEETRLALRKIYNALNPGGLFVFSVKQRAGGGEDWKQDIDNSSGKRYFSYWDIGEAEEAAKGAGFEVLTSEQIGGIRACWLKFIARRPQNS